MTSGETDGFVRPDGETMLGWKRSMTVNLVVANFFAAGGGGMYLGMLLFTPTVQRYSYLVLALTAAIGLSTLYWQTEGLFRGLRTSPRGKLMWNVIVTTVILFALVLYPTYTPAGIWPYVYPDANWWLVLFLPGLFGAAGIWFRVRTQRMIELTDELLSMLP